MKEGIHVDLEMIDRLRGMVRAISEESVEIKADDNLFKTGLLDSMLLIRLVEMIEKEFQISVEDRELSPDYFLTLERMSIFIGTKLSESASKQ
jgi:acyl carrier protein